MAPRVLVDATAVPADRGALGRYVDGLVAALGAAGADLAVACQRNDEERYGRLVPEASIVAGPTAIAHRPARLAWEQTGLPLVAQQVNADVLHAPHYTMPLRPGVPVVVTIHDLTYFTEPDAHNPVTATFFKSAIRTAARRATRLLVPSKATRDELVRVLGADPDPDRCRVPRRGPHAVPPAYPGADAPGVRPARPARQAVRGLPGHAWSRARTSRR